MLYLCAQTIIIMIQQISNYFKRIGVDHAMDTQRDALSFDVTTGTGTWQCLVLLGRQNRGCWSVGFYSTFPLQVPEHLRTQTALYLMCLNNARICGSFELDPQTGDLHFKTYADFDQRGFSERVIERNMLVNISTMQEYMPRLMKMIQGKQIQQTQRA